jgi:hypothetical protein
LGKSGSVVQPVGELVGVNESRFKVVQSKSTKVGQGKEDLSSIVGVGGVVLEEEVAQKDEVVELFGISVIKSIRLFALNRIAVTTFRSTILLLLLFTLCLCNSLDSRT